MEYRLRTLSGLLAFEAAARHGSLTAAAQELARTQSAVSQQVKGLEEEIGLPLFVRRPREIVMTPAGRELAEAVTAALAGINSTIAGLKRRNEPNVLRITVYQSFAINWLIPRLSGFSQQHPELDLRLNADDRPFDLVAEGYDLAIRGGWIDRMPPNTVPVRVEQVMPVYTPGLTNGEDITVETLIRYPLLEIEGRNFWSEWMELNGIEGPVVSAGKAYSHSGMMVQAAMTGAGVALAPLTIAAEALRRGHLKCVKGKPFKSGYGLYMLTAECPPPAKVEWFTDWIRAEMEAMEAELCPYLA